MPNTMFHKRGILLIDDDEQFGKIMAVMAQKNSIPLKHAASLADLGSVGAISEFDLAILDYYLDNMSGVEIAQYMDAFFSSIPVVLISSSNFIQENADKMPKCVVGFVSKESGPRFILDSAVKAMERSL